MQEQKPERPVPTVDDMDTADLGKTWPGSLAAKLLRVTLRPLVGQTPLVIAVGSLGLTDALRAVVVEHNGMALMASNQGGSPGDRFGSLVDVWRGPVIALCAEPLRPGSAFDRLVRLHGAELITINPSL